MAGKGDVQAGGAFVRIFLKDDFTSQLTRSLKSGGQMVASFGKTVVKAGVAMSALGAGMMAPIAIGVKTFMSMGGAAMDAAARTGLSVEALSELGYAARQTGADIGDVELAIKAMAKSGLAREGESAEKAFTRVAAEIAAIPDPLQRAAAAQQAFGRGGMKLLPMIQDMEALRAKARELGIVISTEDAKAADDLGDAWDSLKAQGKAIFFQIGKLAAGPLKEFVTRASEATANVISWIKANGPLIESLMDFNVVSELAITGVKEAFYTGMSEILERWGAWVKPLVEIFAGAMGAVQTIFVKVSGFIADKLLELAGKEGAMGEAARTVLGVDPRASSATNKLYQQEVKSITAERVRLEKGIAAFEAGKTSMVSQGGGGPELSYEAAIARRKTLQERLRNAGSRAAGIGATGVDEARKINEDLTKQALANVETNVAELLNAYGNLAAGGAASTAKELAAKRKQLIDDAWLAAFMRDWDAESAVGVAGVGAGEGDEGVAGGSKFAKDMNLYSAAAIQAAGQSGSSPQSRMVAAMDDMKGTLVDLGVISKDAHLSLKEMTKAFERWVAAMTFG